MGYFHAHRRSRRDFHPLAHTSRMASSNFAGMIKMGTPKKSPKSAPVFKEPTHEKVLRVKYRRFERVLASFPAFVGVDDVDVQAMIQQEKARARAEGREPGEFSFGHEEGAAK